jgi:hypothetical protein
LGKTDHQIRPNGGLKTLTVARQNLRTHTHFNRRWMVIIHIGESAIHLAKEEVKQTFHPADSGLQA